MARYSRAGCTFDRPFLERRVIGQAEPELSGDTTVLLTSIGALFLFVSHREMKTRATGCPDHFCAQKALIGLLLIFAVWPFFCLNF